MSKQQQQLKVAMYLRKSTDEEDRQIKSIDDQREECRQLILREHYKKICEYVDCVSGWKYRPQYEQMLLDANKGKYDLIVCLDRSRFSRDEETKQIADKDHLADCAIKMHFVHGGIFDPSEIGLQTIGERVFETMNVEYSRELGRRVLDAKKNRQQEGFPTGRPPYGYRHWPKVEIKPNIYVRDLSPNKTGYMLGPKEEIELIVWMFQSYADGMSRRQIALQANAKGFRTSSGKMWIRETINQTLRREAYIGHTIFNMSSRSKWNMIDNGVVVTKRKGKKQQVELVPIRIENTHQPIISMELWNRVQNRLNRRKENRQRDSSRHPLTGLLKCDHCGGRLTGHKAGKHVYYKCLGWESGRCKKQYSIREDVVALMLVDILERIPKEMGKCGIEQQELANVNESKRQTLEKEITRLEQQIERATENILVCSNVKLVQKLETKFTQMEEQLAILKSQLIEQKNQQPETKEIVDELIGRLPKSFGTREDLFNAGKLLAEIGCVIGFRWKTHAHRVRTEYRVTSFRVRLGQWALFGNGRYYSNKMNHSGTLCPQHTVRVLPNHDLLSQVDFLVTIC